MQIGLGDFDVVAEDVVEADLERCDAGASALALLYLHEVRAAVLRDIAQLVERGVETGANRPAVGKIHGRFFGDGCKDAIADLGNRIQPRLNI